jgi:hypothetical protein
MSVFSFSLVRSIVTPMVNHGPKKAAKSTYFRQFSKYNSLKTNTLHNFPVMCAIARQMSTVNKKERIDAGISDITKGMRTLRADDTTKVSTPSFLLFCAKEGGLIHENSQKKVDEFRQSGYNLWRIAYPLQGDLTKLSLEWRYALHRVGPSVEKIILHSFKLSLETIKLLVLYFPNLTELNLNNCELTNEALSEIGRLKKLQRLYIKDNPQIDEKGLSFLKELPLVELDISRCENIKNLQALQEIKSLKMIFCFHSSNELDLEPLKTLEQLSELGISLKKIEALPCFPTIKTLFLSLLSNDFEGNYQLQDLKKYFPNLENLEVGYSLLNQVGEHAIGEFSSLQTVVLNGKSIITAFH